MRAVTDAPVFTVLPGPGACLGFYLSLSLSRQLKSKGAERQVSLWAVQAVCPQSVSGPSPPSLVLLRSCSRMASQHALVIVAPSPPSFPAGAGSGFPCLSLPSGRGAGWLETI